MKVTVFYCINALKVCSQQKYCIWLIKCLSLIFFGVRRKLSRGSGSISRSLSIRSLPTRSVWELCRQLAWGKLYLIDVQVSCDRQRGGWLTRRTDWSTGPIRMFSQDFFSVVDSSVILITLLLECNFIFMSYSVSSVKMASKRKSVTVRIGTKTPSYILCWCSWIAYCNCKRVRRRKTICFQLLGKKDFVQKWSIKTV